MEPQFSAGSSAPAGLLLLLQLLLHKLISMAGSVSNSEGAAVPPCSCTVPIFLPRKDPLASTVVRARLPRLEFMETVGLSLESPFLLQQGYPLAGVKLCLCV